MSYIWLSFCSSWDFILSHVSPNIKFPCSTREFTMLGCPLKSFRNAVECDQTTANRFQRATKCGKFSRAAWESTNFVLIAVFMQVALEIIKRAQHCISLPNSYVFMCFEIEQVYLRSVASIVYKGHLQNE